MARRLAQASTMLVVFGVLVGCSTSDEQREYSVPAVLCGVPVDPDLVSPFLPPGKTVSVRKKTPVPSRTRCQMDVDGKWALIASQEWWTEGSSISEVADAHPELESAQPTDGNALLHSGTGAVARVGSCANADLPEHVLYTAIQVYASEREDASAMKKLITEYTNEVERSSACR